jgi:UPF0176 protein
MNKRYTVCALYKFVLLENYQTLKAPLLKEMLRLGIRGTLLLAKEGINGTIAGKASSIKKLFHWLAQTAGLEEIDNKESYTDTMPFKRTKVKLKKEIVTLGVPDISPTECVGQYVDPKEWNALISSPDVVLVDTRNDYEVDIGTFKNALNPKTETFRDFPKYVDDALKNDKDKKIAMFCTGGIRCEKSTALLLKKGFKEVYHLKGGILKYIEEIPKEESLWEGECFVFDDRVAVDHALKPGNYNQCYACRYPITQEDEKSDHYEKGVSCPRCFHTISDEQKERFAERQKQVMLASKRGESHIGN